MGGDQRPRLRSVRARTAAVASLVVGIALVIASAGLVLGLRMSMTNDLRTTADLRADDVADVLSTAEQPGDIAVDDEEEMFVQVLDSDGRVVQASPNLGDEAAVATLEPGQSARVRGLEFEDDEFLVVARRADTPDGPLTVLVGRNTEVIGKTIGTAIRLLMLGVPVLLLITAIATWRLTGRALAPVEAVRREVEEITAAELSRRISVPPTGDEVARLAGTMNDMLTRLDDAHTRQQRFVSDASHELRSPLATIRQHAEVARARPDETATADLAEVVLAEDLRLQRLVEDLLWLARGDENVLLTRRRAVNVDDLVLEELTRLRSDSGLTVDSSRLSGGRVSGDPTLLRLLLRNLIENAARHARTTVAIGLTEDADTMVLTVDDDGTGVPPADRGRIFERFVRLDDARSRDAGGAGLGLAIATEIAAAHDGTLTVGDSPLGGARFEVLLPVSD